VVCSDIHGYKGVVKRDEQALLVPPGDHRELAEAILRLVGDPALRERLSQSGLERVQEFGWDRIAARVEAYYGFVIRRLAAQGTLPPHFRAEVPPDPRTGAPAGQ
jgi:glycosyltransferase involved in cell wall biosynthesis